MLDTPSFDHIRSLVDNEQTRGPLLPGANLKGGLSEAHMPKSVSSSLMTRYCVIGCFKGDAGAEDGLRHSCASECHRC